MEYVARLFPEARARQRRRRRLLASGLALAIVLALAVQWALSPAPVPQPGIAAPPGTPVLAPAAVFAQDPYMGVHCPQPNSIACDQVGLAIWLKRPAVAVTASVDGRMLSMNRSGDRLVGLGGGPRTEFDGYLQPAGIRSSFGVHPEPGTNVWGGDPTPYATVWLLIDYGAGRQALTHDQVPLEAGWG